MEKLENAKKQNFVKRVYNWLFGSSERIGLILMVLSLVCFFCCAHNKIPSAGFLNWIKGKSKLDMGLNMENGLIALALLILMYIRGILTLRIFDSNLKTPQKFLEACKFVINWATVSALVCMCFNPYGNANIVVNIGKAFRDVLLVFGIVAGIVLFGSKQTSKIALLIMLIVTVYKCCDNVKAVSKAMGEVGWWWIVFMFFGIVLQENINFSALRKELANLISIGKKITNDGMDATDEAVSTVKKNVKETAETVIKHVK